ncbi:MAG: adenylosuccinate synthetase, partial [Brevibacterium aurantiacum]
ARTFEDLPENAQKYVLALEERSGCRMSVIGVGPDREQSIVRHDLLD